MPSKKRGSRKFGKKKKIEPPIGRERAIVCARAAAEKKAEDIVILDISGLSGFADYFVICHGVGEPHVRAIAENVGRKMHESGARVIGEEGLLEARWVVLDTGDVVVHVFDESVRDFYDLERLWIHAEEVEFTEE